MCTLTTAYAEFTAKAQAICDAFPYAEKLTAKVAMGFRLDDDQPYIAVSAFFDGMTAERRAELTAAGVVAPNLLAQTCMCADEATALEALANELGLVNPFAPVVYATGPQKQDIIRLLNHPTIERGEKATGLRNLNRYTEALADELIIGLKRDINARSGHVVFPEVAEYAVVGEVYVVGQQQQAA